LGPSSFPFRGGCMLLLGSRKRMESKHLWM
jgi:hypothetical protein